MRTRVPVGQVVIDWLGQAGFAISGPEHRILVDPYLSDSLAVKYADRVFRHERLMRPPIDIGSLPELDAVFCTHGHTDHLDPWTLGPIGALRRDVAVVVPRAHLAKAEAAGVPGDNLIGIDAGETVTPRDGLSLTAVLAAHEAIEHDDDGHSLHLGVIIEIDGHTIYHSGDCTPFLGLAEVVTAHHPGLALLPVNGRDAGRRENGVPGNFHYAEAVDLCRQTGTPEMIAHHHGMFAFNTVDASVLDRQIERTSDVIVHRARLGVRYVIGQRNVAT